MRNTSFVSLFLFKLLTSLDGYFYFALSPILVFLVSKDIKIMGVFFLIESITKFLSYGASGTIANTLNPKRNLVIAQSIRTLAATSSILFFLYGNQNKLYYILICNLCFVMANSLLSTNFDILIQKRKEFGIKTQGNISAGDLFSGTLALIILLLLLVTKVQYQWYILIILFFTIGSFISISYYVTELHEPKKNSFYKTVVNVFRDLIHTSKIIKDDKDILQNTIIGYIPLSLYMIIEQVNIVEFAQNFDHYQMQIFHFLVKICLFFLSGLIVPVLMQKLVEIHKLLLTAIVFMFIGGLLSIIRVNIAMDLIGIILLGMSHTLVLNFRKVKRRHLMVEKGISFSTLGFLFAIEGLSGVIANTYLAIFGKQLIILTIFAIGGLLFLIHGYRQENLNK